MAKVRTEFPHAVEVIDPAWITLADGTRIGATIWRPKTSERVPAVVEMIPYRRLDRGAKLVERQCRDDRHLMGRIQFAAGGGAAPAGAQGHHAVMRKR